MNILQDDFAPKRCFKYIAKKIAEPKYGRGERRGEEAAQQTVCRRIERGRQTGIHFGLSKSWLGRKNFIRSTPVLF